MKTFKSLGAVNDTMCIVVQTSSGQFSAYLPSPSRAEMLEKLKRIFPGKPIYQWDVANAQWKREDI